MDKRYDRNIRFFGQDGQNALKNSRVTIAGVGGLGTHVAQQLAYLGVGRITLIDNEHLDETNLNRYVLAFQHDLDTQPLKVDIAESRIALIDPSIKVQKVAATALSAQAFDLLKQSDWVFGCFDRDGPRFVINELCAAYSIPYTDLATEIIPGTPVLYGGRVCTSFDGNGCLACMDVLDMEEVRADLGGASVVNERRALYGVDNTDLGGSGPSVVSLNGVIASYAVTEFMLGATGIRPPVKLAEYRGHEGKIFTNSNPGDCDCYYCKELRGSGDNANIDRYINP
ncbi:MAG TPA: ThiF family adenylyltransferase [Gammaproteobacteria bacterium]|nr:ThiF family adenylyltransferase [Gammaproteobacteria bacterium]